MPYRAPIIMLVVTAVVIVSRAAATIGANHAGGDRQQNAGQSNEEKLFHDQLHERMTAARNVGMPTSLLDERDPPSTRKALLMDRDVDDSVCRNRRRIARRHTLPGLARPARLHPVRREVAAIHQRITHGIGASV